MNQDKINKKIQREFRGTVVSTKGDKTLIVAVKRSKLHPKYLKRYAVTKKYKVHDEKNIYQAGQEVSFVECRPLSKDKRWRVLDQNKEEN